MTVSMHKAYLITDRNDQVATPRTTFHEYKFKMSESIIISEQLQVDKLYFLKMIFYYVNNTRTKSNVTHKHYRCILPESSGLFLIWQRWWYMDSQMTRENNRKRKCPVF